MRHYLVDFENVNDEGLREIGALQKDCCIHIFFSASSARISLEYLTLMRNASVKAHKVSDDSTSLDVHIATTLGYLIGSDADQQDSFFIVSAGHDFSELVRFWGRRGVNIHMITIRERHDGYERPTAFRQAASAVPRPVQVRPLARPAARPMERRPRPDFTRPERPRPVSERPAPVYVEPKAEPAPVMEHVEPAEPVQAEPELKPEPVVFEPKEPEKQVEVIPEPDVKHITPVEEKDPVKVIPERSANGVLQIKTDRPDSEIFTPDVLAFVNRTLSSRADDPNLKQIIYMAIVSKYGQKKGLAIYRRIKDFVEE